LAILERGLRLLDVEGNLEDHAVTRWSRVLTDAIKGAVTGLAVDLRGCGAVDPICLSALLAASSTLRARGGAGVKLVTNPGSPLEGRLQSAAAKELPAYATASRALLALRDA